MTFIQKTVTTDSSDETLKKIKNLVTTRLGMRHTNDVSDINGSMHSFYTKTTDITASLTKMTKMSRDIAVLTDSFIRVDLNGDQSTAKISVINSLIDNLFTQRGICYNDSMDVKNIEQLMEVVEILSNFYYEDLSRNTFLPFLHVEYKSTATDKIIVVFKMGYGDPKNPCDTLMVVLNNFKHTYRKTYNISCDEINNLSRNISGIMGHLSSNPFRNFSTAANNYDVAYTPANIMLSLMRVGVTLETSEVFYEQYCNFIKRTLSSNSEFKSEIEKILEFKYLSKDEKKYIITMLDITNTIFAEIIARKAVFVAQS